MANTGNWEQYTTVQSTPGLPQRENIEPTQAEAGMEPGPCQTTDKRCLKESKKKKLRGMRCPNKILSSTEEAGKQKGQWPSQLYQTLYRGIPSLAGFVF